MRISPALTLVLLACGPGGRGFDEVEPDLFVAEVSDFDARFDATGMSAVSRRDRIGLSLEGAAPVAPTLTDCPQAASCAAQLRYERGDLVEWWRHRGGGLQHGFTLRAPLEPTSASGEVSLSLIVTGATPRGTAQGAVLRTPSGELWRYERLRVRDAGGRMLPSALAVVDDRIELRFDATGARYPIDVDPSLTADQAQILPSDVAPSLGFGEVVASGDLNGDGYDDLAVGASASDRRGSSSGEAYLYEGGPDGIDTSTELTVFASDATSSDRFGRGVQLDADIDGDGDVELIVSAPAGDGLVSSSGKLYVYDGTGAGIDTSAETEVYASDGKAGDAFGSPVSAPGDMNGDGLDDIAVRASGHPAVYAYFGSSTGLTDELKIDPTDYGLPNMGMYLSADADVNGDGYEDLLVGCPDRDGRSSSTGTVYIFHGQSSGLDTGSPEQVYASDGGSGDKFGPVASAGDLDADGYDDIVVGAYQDDDTATDAGAVYLYPGSSLGVASAYEYKITASTGTSSDNFGIDVAATGSGVLVGAQKADGAASSSGVLYAYDADASTLVDSATERKYSATEAGASDLLGEDIQGRYDVNGDGVNDWIAGAADNDDGASGGGAVFVLEQELDEDDDGYGAGDDCDDADDSVHPGATEACDGIDNDCDEDTEDQCWSPDADGDGYGDMATHVDAADAGTGYIDNDEDCDDDDASVHPGATETAGDEFDQDCDGEESCYQDLDEDGVRTDITVRSSDTDCSDPIEAAGSTPDGDCDDSDATVYPGAPEIIADGVDQDCDGQESCYADADEDGYRPDDTPLSSEDLDCTGPGEADASTPDGDCDDADAAISPDADEAVGDEIDQDCDGVERCYADQDDDGYRPDETSEVGSLDASCGETGEARADEPTGDCDDADPAAYPGAPELVADEIDEDCDGGELCLSDADGDGYRPDDTSTVISTDAACDGPGEAGWAHPSEDCADDDATVYPGAPELADGLDNDCNGYDELTDADSDDLTEYEETALGTDPNDADSDDDGLSDGEEVHEHGTDPLTTDTDADGLSDAAEVDEHGTSPTDADSDDDGLDDRAEIEDHGTDPLSADTDGDGLDDRAEIEDHGTDPLSADSDNDGLGDGDEIGVYGTDPNDGNSDDDGLLDGEEVMTWHTDPLDAESDDDGLLDGEEIEVYGTDPLNDDSDGDTLSDWTEVFETGTDANDADTDDDRLDDAAELETWGTDPHEADTDGDGVDDRAEVEGTGTDPLDEDSDDDSLSDGDEIITWHTDPLSADSDGDGLGDADEIYTHGTNPNAADTDGGSISDADELEAGTDPLVASDDLGNTVTKNRSCATGSGGGLWGLVVAALMLCRRLAARPAPREGEACPSSPASPTCPSPASGSAPSMGRPRRPARSIR